MTVGDKFCWGCETIKPVTEFYDNVTRCKECIKNGPPDKGQEPRNADELMEAICKKCPQKCETHYMKTKCEAYQHYRSVPELWYNKWRETYG